MRKAALEHWIEENKSAFESLARRIWENPELAYQEKYAASEQIKVLKEAGFRLRERIGGIPTAFIAEIGSGRPVIGILGEFDALPGLAQRVSVTPEPIPGQGAGHGCGHHLLGTAGVEAAVALKNRLLEEGLPGTIRYYGCPAEEVLSGKTFMAREGAFDDLDAALTWHPGSSNLAISASTSALTSVEFRFKGRTAHAGIAPHLGRSALDAVELTNVGANYLREHVPDGVRIHYVITNGGVAPNIVPESASVWYYVRGANRSQVDGIFERLAKIAQGAALMTETEVSWEIKAGAYNVLPNESLNGLLLKQTEEASPLLFTEEDRNWADSLAKTLDPEALRQSVQFHQKLGLEVEDLLPTGSAAFKPNGSFGSGGSTDLGDVSWIVPTGSVMTTCAPIGVQLHTWQATAAFGSAIGYKGMHYAAKLIAFAAYELLSDGGEALQSAKAEFEREKQGRTYAAAIPAEVKAPVLEAVSR